MYVCVCVLVYVCQYVNSREMRSSSSPSSSSSSSSALMPFLCWLPQKFVLLLRFAFVFLDILCLLCICICVCDFVMGVKFTLTCLMLGFIDPLQSQACTQISVSKIFLIFSTRIFFLFLFLHNFFCSLWLDHNQESLNFVLCRVQNVSEGDE